MNNEILKWMVILYYKAMPCKRGMGYRLESEPMGNDGKATRLKRL